MAAVQPLQGQARALLARVPFVVLLSAGVAAAAPPLTLEQAWQQAEQANPSLRSAQTALAAAQGELADARAPLRNNPQISGEWLRRRVYPTGEPSHSWPEWNAGLSQTFEIAGQQGIRRNAAEQSLAAYDESVAETRRQVRAEVEQRFVQVLGLQLRIATEAQALRLVEETAEAVGKRVAAGEDSRLDGNLAEIEAERARNQVALLREQLTQARADLAKTLQLAPEDMPEVSGSLDPKPSSYTLQELLASAARRPALRALAHREGTARNRLGLERAAVYPDVTLGLNILHEGPTDAREKAVGLSVSVPLPLFNRNGSGIGRAATELAQVQVERQAAERDVRAETRALWKRAEDLGARVHRLQTAVLPRLEENQRLSLTAFRSGEIGLTELLLVNRQVLDGRRDLLEARTDYRLVRIALEAAAGWPPEPP